MREMPCLSGLRDKTLPKGAEVRYKVIWTILGERGLCPERVVQDRRGGLDPDQRNIQRQREVGGGERKEDAGGKGTARRGGGCAVTQGPDVMRCDKTACLQAACLCKKLQVI